MKKILGILLGLCFVIPAVMAAEVSDINKAAWLSHLKEMNIMRRQIVELSNKENKTAEDMESYDKLMRKFEAKQIAWDEYITAVANDDAEGRAKVENKFENHRHFGKHDRGGKRPEHFRKLCECCKCERCRCKDCECCKCEGCNCEPKARFHKPCHKHHKCDKADKCCGKCEKKCMKADKCEKKCDKAAKCEKKCDKAAKCEKKCMKADKCCGKCEEKCQKKAKCEKKCCEKNNHTESIG